MQEIQFDFVSGQELSSRFCIDARHQNRHLYDRIRYLDPREMFSEEHFIAFTPRDRIVGNLAIQHSPYDPDEIWLKHVSVDADFRNHGIATRLLSECFNHVASNRKRLKLSRFSDDGERHLVDTIRLLAEDARNLDLVWPDGFHTQQPKPQ